MLTFSEIGPWVAFMYITKLNTDETGEPFANKFLAVAKNLIEAIRDQDLRTYAELLPQAIPAGYAWIPHMTIKENQESSAKILQLLQHIRKIADYKELSLDDVDMPLEQITLICEKFLKQLSLYYKC